jgi:hypothetical protein
MSMRILCNVNLSGSTWKERSIVERYVIHAITNLNEILVSSTKFYYQKSSQFESTTKVGKKKQLIQVSNLHKWGFVIVRYINKNMSQQTTF